MTKLQGLLREAGIRTAVVVDDVFDAVPRPDELDDRDWSVFFDDLGDEGADVLACAYPAYRETSTEELKSSAEFIRIVWENRTRLPNGVATALFSEYSSGNAGDRRNLDMLISALEGLGLECRTTGGALGEGAESADLIVADLFLGFRQVDKDVDRAIGVVKALVERRARRPPLVILMSRSPRLAEIQDDFRDKAGLLGSTFRVIRKADLADRSGMERLLTRLADHYEDAKRVARFVQAWDLGLDQARRRFIRALRRLDLWDIAQIRALLLDFEGQELSEYLLDVADRVLQHEIEGAPETISAALDLNKIEVDKYPAPHLTGSSDLQELVHRMVFLHSERLRLSAGSDIGSLQLQFGDVLRWTGEGGDVSDDVSLVVTPACDLMRRGVKRVMLLSGELLSLEPGNWSYSEAPVRTPIVVLPDGERRWIKWNVKDVRTLSWAELENVLAESPGLDRIGRLREIYAVEIQQKMIDALGRIGNPANLPGSFSVQVALFFVGEDSKARRIVFDGSGAAACYVGRDKDSKPVHRLVLTEEACDEIERAIGSLEEEEVRGSLRRSLCVARAGRTLFRRLERGEVEVPDRSEGHKVVKAGNQVVAVVCRGEEFDEGSETRGALGKAAVIVRVTDV